MLDCCSSWDWSSSKHSTDCVPCVACAHGPFDGFTSRGTEELDTQGDQGDASALRNCVSFFAYSVGKRSTSDPLRHRSGKTKQPSMCPAQ
jgi:hypothetical protein